MRIIATVVVCVFAAISSMSKSWAQDSVANDSFSRIVVTDNGPIHSLFKLDTEKVTLECEGQNCDRIKVTITDVPKSKDDVLSNPGEFSVDKGSFLLMLRHATTGNFPDSAWNQPLSGTVFSGLWGFVIGTTYMAHVAPQALVYTMGTMGVAAANYTAFQIGLMPSRILSAGQINKLSGQVAGLGPESDAASTLHVKLNDIGFKHFVRGLRSMVTHPTLYGCYELLVKWD